MTDLTEEELRHIANDVELWRPLIEQYDARVLEIAALKARCERLEAALTRIGEKALARQEHVIMIMVDMALAEKA